jgi:hypothetical protein
MRFEETAGIRLAVMDMWKPFRASTSTHAPQTHREARHLLAHPGPTEQALRRPPAPPLDPAVGQPGRGDLAPVGDEPAAPRPRSAPSIAAWPTRRQSQSHHRHRPQARDSRLPLPQGGLATETPEPPRTAPTTGSACFVACVSARPISASPSSIATPARSSTTQFLGRRGASVLAARGVRECTLRAARSLSEKPGQSSQRGSSS